MKRLTQLQVEAIFHAVRAGGLRRGGDRRTGVPWFEDAAGAERIAAPGKAGPWTTEDRTVRSLEERGLLEPAGGGMFRCSRPTDAGRAALTEARRGGCPRCRQGLTRGQTCGSCGRESTMGRPT